MSRPARAVLLAFVAVLAVFQVPSAPADSAEAPLTDMDLCANLVELPGVGPACPRGIGFYEVFGTRGESLGYTHGADPAPCAGCEEPVVVNSGTTPHCVSATPGTYYVHAIYARASNDADRYATIAPVIRQLVGDANQYVDDAGVATGSGLNIRILCSGGVVTVENLVLPTSMSSDNFSSIVSDIRALGYNDPKQKYWVWYDDNASNPACGCSGTGHIFLDDQPGAANTNNGNAANAMFAVNFGYVSVNTWLHELGHNLGAVQNSAPFTSGAGHCVDGLDIMCYADGGPNSGNYSSSYCAVRVFDCNKNTYCHADPVAGTYLALKWNVCGANQRFLERSVVNVAPVMQSLSCTPTSPLENQTVTCTFRATDPGHNLSYSINWGDGTATQRVPTTGYVASNTTQSATHAYTRPGNATVRVNATDDRSPALTGGNLTQTLNVIDVNAAPVMRSLSCTTATLQPGAAASCTFNASDDNTGVRYRVEWGDGQTSFVPSSTTYVTPGPFRNATHTYANVGNYSVNVSATDNATSPLTGNTSTATVRVANNAPVMQTLTCTTTSVYVGDPVSCSFNATDDSAGVRYLVEWGDGLTTNVPASGAVAPGPLRFANHTYASAGNFTVRVTATDNVTSAPLTSAPRTTTVRIITDTTPPTLTVTDPVSGFVYVGCGIEESKPTAGILFVQRGCVRAVAADPGGSGVARVEVRSRGVILASDTTSPYQIEFAVQATELGTPYEVRAYDRFNNVAIATFLADGIAT